MSCRFVNKNNADVKVGRGGQAPKAHAKAKQKSRAEPRITARRKKT